jgi:hypothetical protein
VSEIVWEDEKEQDTQRVARPNRFSIVRDLNEFSSNSNPSKKHRSLDRLKRKKGITHKFKIETNISHNDVFETDEE